MSTKKKGGGAAGGLSSGRGKRGCMKREGKREKRTSLGKKRFLKGGVFLLYWNASISSR